MHVAKIIHSTVAILAIKGSLVSEEMDKLDVEVEECVEKGIIRVVLDLKEVPFIDSAGLEKIQDIVSNLGKRGGDLRIVSLNDVCADIFLATRMESFVQVSPDRDAAVRSLL